MKKIHILLLVVAFQIATGIFQETNAQTYLTRYGHSALYFNTTGDKNSAFGYYALFLNTTGSFNSALGNYALSANTTGIYNTAIGESALMANKTGYYNSAAGALALAANTTGNWNTASGYKALSSNTTGSNNSATGAHSLNSNTTGRFNSANGTYALFYNKAGSYNTASGYRALYANDSSSYNSAYGMDALYSNTKGHSNTALGVRALYRNTSGYDNTATGDSALHFNTTGFNNTAAGNYALRNNTTGSRNSAFGDSAGAIFNGTYGTFIGYKSDATGTGFTNVTAIGHRASATASNQVRIGNTSVTSIGGKVGWTTLSDGRYKKNIQDDVSGLSFIIKLRPVTYTLDIAAIDKASGLSEQGNAEEAHAKAAAAKEKHTGFVAQDVEKVATELKYDFGGVDKPKSEKDFYGLRYAEFVVPLVKGMQEQQNQIEKQQQQIELQQQQIEDLKAMVTRLANGQAVSINTLTSVYLEQNTPNPVNSATTIRYHVPTTTTSAYLTLTNAKGQAVKTISLSNRGVGQVNLNTQGLSSGTYQYTLYVDGNPVDTKRLVIAQ